MKKITKGYVYYSNYYTIIRELNDKRSLIPCFGCIHWSIICSLWKGKRICADGDFSVYRPVKIRKVIMKKLIKRRKRHEK